MKDSRQTKLKLTNELIVNSYSHNMAKNSEIQNPTFPKKKVRKFRLFMKKILPKFRPFLKLLQPVFNYSFVFFRFKWDYPGPIHESHYAALSIKLDCRIRKRGQPATVKWYKNDQEITDKSNRT